MLPPIFDPHERLAELVEASRSSYAALSRMIDRPDGFLRRFAIDRVPSRLRDGERELLAAFFGVGEHELGAAAPKRTVPSRDPRRPQSWRGRRGTYVD